MSSLMVGCESEELSWLQAGRRKPAGWVVVAVLVAYIAVDKADILRWHSASTSSDQAGWVRSGVDPEGILVNESRTFARGVEEAWSHPRDGPVEFRQLQLAKQGARRTVAAPNATATTASEDNLNSTPHDALFFLVIAMIVGTAVTFLTTFPFFHGIQQSVALFVIGGLFAILLEGAELKQHLGVLGTSFDMWMRIDPHLLLFTLLPPLLTGDAMTLDTSVARRVASQCVYLASAGVLCNTFLAAVFLYAYLPYDWSFLQCMTSGAILCATDPVAVVALLKELGASPTLTVQIQGESLLNDGTAMVLYAITYSMIQGDKYDAYDIMIYLLKKVALAVGIGIAIGYLFLFWIRNTKQLQHEHASMIQISLTICCAYWSFIISEGVLHINGVLATVAAALVLAHMMWPAIVNKESMHTVWHTLEYMGNTTIFFLAGALAGKSSTYVSWIDYLHCVVIWFILIFIRGLVILLSRPVLRMLNEEGQPVTLAEVIVITWGGLRGALGLALAMQVALDRAGGEISEQDAARVLFYVGGVAALTLVINATTCPMLVKKLGITRIEPAKRRMLLLMHRRLLELSLTRSESEPVSVTRAIERMLVCTYQSINTHRRKRAFDTAKQSAKKNLAVISESAGLVRSQTASFLKKSSGISSSTVTTDWKSSPTGFSSASHKKKAHLDVPQDTSEGDDTPSNGKRLLSMESTGFNMTRSHMSALARDVSYVDVSANISSYPSEVNWFPDSIAKCLKLGALLDYVKVEEQSLQPMSDLLDEFAEAKMKFNMIPQESFALMGEFPEMPTMDMDSGVMYTLPTYTINEDLLRVMNEGFFACVQSHYYKLMETGDLRPGSPEVQVLLNSISLALHASHKDLLDFRFVSPFIRKKYNVLKDDETVADLGSEKKLNSIIPQYAKKRSLAKTAHDTLLHRVVESMPFQIAMVAAILINAAFMVMEEELRDESNDGHPGWLVADICFCVIFILEALLKIADQRARYFADLWNDFDFVLVILGVVGVVFNIVASNMPADYSTQGRVVRVARVFRVMRLMRLFRLVRLIQGITVILFQQQGALEVQEHIKKITILTFFVKAHCLAQNEYVDYFGNKGVVDIGEVARVILQSQVSVFKAFSMAMGEEHLLNDQLLQEVNMVRESKALAEELERFVMDAYNGGVVSHREADALLEPVRHHIKVCMEEFSQPIIRFPFGKSRTRSVDGGAKSTRSSVASVRPAILEKIDRGVLQNSINEAARRHSIAVTKTTSGHSIQSPFSRRQKTSACSNNSGDLDESLPGTPGSLIYDAPGVVPKLVGRMTSVEEC